MFACHTCPHHQSLCSRIFSVIGVTPISYLTVVFLIRSKQVKPIIPHSILISITWNRCYVVLVVGQHLAPYRATRRITVLSIKDIKRVGVILSQKTPVTSLHLIQAAFILAPISIFLFPSLVKYNPKLSVLLSSVSSTSIVCELGPVSNYSVFFRFMRKPY